MKRMLLKENFIGGHRVAEKDISEKAFIALNDVFADIFNVLVFEGKMVVEENALADQMATSQYKADEEKMHEQERDVFKKWKGHGFNLVLAGIENQTEPDRDMPFRVIAYDGVAYRSQVLSKKRTKGKQQHRKAKKERYPVVTIVLYFGEKTWNYPKNLKNSFYPPLPQNEAGKILDKYIQDYKIHVFDIPRLPKETVVKFQSDFKVVAEYFTNVYTNPEYVPQPYVIRHVDEFLKLMRVLTGDGRYETVMFSKEEKEEGIEVCRVLDYREAKGKADTLISLVKKGLLPTDKAAEEMGIAEEAFLELLAKEKTA